ncbi:MAG: hypothetical protein H7Z71_00185 [Moraxellaceae bacterium]|nr:hypothetical protein [Pseudobdellovibrionaceae bacterium]
MKFFVFLICFFKLTLLQAPVRVDYFIIRDVGQGLWATRIQNDSCDHFDFGGEIFQSKKLKKQFISQCSNRKNILHLSHAHWDHYAFLDLIFQNSIKTCWAVRPPEHLINEPRGIPYCETAGQIIYYNSNSTNKNDRSIIQQFHSFLMPGDSSTKMEKLWQGRLRYSKPSIKYLVLGHHGSRTATGDGLLRDLPGLQQVVASARFQKYRHPHAETVKKLKKFGVPLIKTEDWGDIQINY